ncbi:hypothetical protein GF312_16810 [Candidatus Poribacteria bacterium]|nr:hypothetical protein [Candidatus Poribacteria bacterium]
MGYLSTEKKLSRLFISIFTCLLFPAIALTCTIPVYQYSLAYWDSDPYEITIFHRGQLSSKHQDIATKLQEASWKAENLANITLRMVDLDNSTDIIMQKLWESQENTQLPWVIVKYPRTTGIQTEIWSGELDSSDLNLLLDSPMRREIIRRIIKGEAGVWLLLESGNKELDDQAAQLLEQELRRLSDLLRVSAPPGTADQIDEESLKVSFSMIRLSRENPREKLFVEMLLNTEWDLKTFSKPIAFPVFGRGRVLYALVGEGIRQSNIESACLFLINWCSCIIKDQNPGVDMLMSVDWDRAINDDVYAETRLFTETYTETDLTEEKVSSNFTRNIMIAVAIQVLVIAVIAVFVVRRRIQRD